MNYSVRIPPDKIQSWVLSTFPDNKPRKNGSEIRINNPFDGDTGYHFNINLEGRCHDWRGNSWVGINPKTGEQNKCTFLKFVQLYLNCSWEEATKAVLGSSFNFQKFRYLIGQEKLQKHREGKKEVSLGIPDGAKSLSAAKGTIVTGLKAWLLTRGMDERVISKYRMMYSGFDIIWPYYEYDELVYWQSRSRLNKEFAFPPLDIGVGKGDFIYGFDQIEPSSYLIITEALIDSITVEEQCGASGGATLTDTQVRKIKALNPRDGIILAPDNDGAGLQSILDNYKKLKSSGFPILYSIPPELPIVDKEGKPTTTKDWNDVGKVVGFSNVKGIVSKNAKSITIATIRSLHSLVADIKQSKLTDNFRIQ